MVPALKLINGFQINDLEVVASIFNQIANGKHQQDRNLSPTVIFITIFFKSQVSNLSSAANAGFLLVSESRFLEGSVRPSTLI